MENTNPRLAPIQEVEQELQDIVSPDFRGVAPAKQYRAAYLFARINREFEDAQGGITILGCLTFDDWMNKFRQTRQCMSRRNIFYYAKIGRYLLPQISEDEFKALDIARAKILATLAKAGRLSPDILRASFDCSKHELEEKVAPLLGKEASWTDHPRIDSHESAEAALLLLGNKLDFETYTADRGKQFRGQALGEIATLRDLPRFATEQAMKSVARIDVIWLREDYPEYFFEVENTTDVTSGLHRMFQVVKYSENFFIVGPEDVRPRFLRETEKAPFKSVKQKYTFRSYTELLTMFRVAMKYWSEHALFFDKEG